MPRPWRAHRPNQIGLVEQHDIGKGKLFLRFVRSIELAQEVLGVDNSYDRIELGFAMDVLIDKEGLRDRGRICKACGFDQYPVESSLPPHQSTQYTDEIAADGAANAAVVHLENLLVRIDDEIIVDPTSPNSLTMTA